MNVTKAEFARLKGWNRSTVTRYADAEKLVMTSDGLVDVDASELRLKALADASKEGVRLRHERERALRDAGGEYRGEPGRHQGDGRDGSRGDSTRPDPTDSSYLQLQKHRADSEAHRAALLSMERAEKEGRLVDRDMVRKLAFETGRLVQSRLMSMRHTVDPELACEPDPDKRAAIWDKHTRSICDELDRKVEELEG